MHVPCHVHTSISNIVSVEMRLLDLWTDAMTHVETVLHSLCWEIQSTTASVTVN